MGLARHLAKPCTHRAKAADGDACRFASVWPYRMTSFRCQTVHAAASFDYVVKRNDAHGQYVALAIDAHCVNILYLIFDRPVDTNLYQTPRLTHATSHPW